MQVSEIFYSIQGEGTNTGAPAIFLRLSGCHLRCSWCDSKFTWDRKSGKQMTIEQVIKEIKKFPSTHLVITGGEPLLQQSELTNLLKELKKAKYFVEVETSATLETFLNKFIDQYNCSPKLSNSNNKNADLKKEVINSFPKDKTYYKFVIDKESDIKEVESLIKKFDLPKDKIILMPQGITKKAVKEKTKWLIEICKKHNYRLSQRLHIEIWGNKKGY